MRLFETAAVFPDLAKFRQMGEIQVLGGDGFFADGDGEIWLQNSQKWAKLDKLAIFRLKIAKNCNIFQKILIIFTNIFGDFCETSKNDAKR